MDYNAYRIIPASELKALEESGLILYVEEQRVSLDGTMYMVELTSGVSDIGEHINHDEALHVISTPEWSSNHDYEL